MNHLPRPLPLWLLIAWMAITVMAAADITPSSVTVTPQADGSGPLPITLADAILMTLENNRSLAVQRITPAIVASFEAEERAVFDPVLSAGLATQRTVGGWGATDPRQVARGHEGFIALDRYFPTGTSLSLEARTNGTQEGPSTDGFHNSRLGLAVSQSLLQGFGATVNLARLRQAELETRISLFELHGFTETLVARVEHAYWDYALSLRQIEIVQESLKLAEQQLSDTRAMISVGALAESELAAVHAEVARQRQGLINVKNAVSTYRLHLLHLLNPREAGLWEGELILAHPPRVPAVALDEPAGYITEGLRRRPELLQSNLEIERGELEVVRTRNGLLPRLQMFIRLGKSGYAGSFGGSVSDLDGDRYDAQAGLTLAYPLANRSAEARHQRARLGRERAEKAMENLRELVALDIRIAWLEVNRTQEQIAASAATRLWQEEKLRIETEKFRVGRSTNLLVAQAQQDLLVSRIDEVRAVVDYLKSLTDLYRFEGSLLERRGIDLPSTAH